MRQKSRLHVSMKAAHSSSGPRVSSRTTYEPATTIIFPTRSSHVLMTTSAPRMAAKCRFTNANTSVSTSANITVDLLLRYVKASTFLSSKAKRKCKSQTHRRCRSRVIFLVVTNVLRRTRNARHTLVLTKTDDTPAPWITRSLNRAIAKVQDLSFTLFPPGPLCKRI